jgi:hypothetical protein
MDLRAGFIKTPGAWFFSSVGSGRGSFFISSKLVGISTLLNEQRETMS